MRRRRSRAAARTAPRSTSTRFIATRPTTTAGSSRGGDAMNRVITAVVTLIVVLAGAAPTAAHRLDEYLQATRVDIRSDGIVLELDLTPGANLAADILATLDTDGDGIVHASEADAYATEVVRRLEVALDGERLAVGLVNRTIPAVDDLSAGSGVFSLTATATTG